jgi:hypothetical protein
MYSHSFILALKLKPYNISLPISNSWKIVAIKIYIVKSKIAQKISIVFTLIKTNYSYASFLQIPRRERTKYALIKEKH